MKSKFTLLSLAIVLCPVFSSFAQSPAWDWAASTSSNSSFFPKEITVDASGNSYVCGYFSNTLTIGSTVLTSNGGNDLYYAKYDAAGNAVWAKNAGSANNDQATAIVSDRAGDLYMCGIFSGTITLGSTSLTAFGLTSQPFISKLDENGNFIWAISGNGNFSGTARTLTVDASGNIYVVGDYAAASFTIAGFTLTNNDPGPGDENLFFVKLDPNGTGIYAKEAGGPKREYGNAIAVNNSGEVFITGQFFSKTLNFGNGVKLTNSLYGFSDFYLAKFDAAGNILWAKSSGGDLNEEGLYLAADASGNCYVEGRFNSATSTLSPVTLTNNGSTNFLDIFFAKYNAAGNLLWAQNIGGTGDEQPSGIAVSPTGGICFSGSYTSASLTLGTNTLTNNGSADVFAGGLDVNGTVRWATNIGGTQTDNITGFEVDENENIYLNGSYNSPSVSFGSITLTSGGTNNEFVAKLNPNITANAIATGAIAPLTYLAGDAVSVSFVVSGGFGAGNTFTAELSNASGSFTAPVAIGSLAATTSGTISATIPLATASGSGYRIRVVSDDPIVTGTDNGADITISASSVCPLPVSVNISDITTTTALVSWTGNASASSYRIRKRPVGTTTWIYSSVTAPVTSKTLSNNIPATNYEVQLQTYCNVAKTDSSGYTASVNFTSASACTGTSSVSTTGTTASAATLNWTYTSAPSKWTIKYRVSATSTWTTVNISGSLTSYVLNSLTASTNYDWKIRAKCGSEHSDFSAVQHFTTSSSRLAEVMSENSFSIYPNPAKEEISLQLAVGSTYPVSIRVYDLNGKEMATWLNDQMTEGMHTLSFNVASFAKGIYFVRMISGNGIQNQKLIVQ